jgi:membrane protease YdiL (CAAX protease family)
MSAPATVASGGRVWGPWASIAWSAFAIVAWFGTQVVFANRLIAWFDSGAADAATLAADGRFVAMVSLGAMNVPLFIIALAVWSTRSGLTEYLGLYWPERRYVVIGIAVLAILIPVVDLVSVFAGQAVTPKFVTDLYTSARDSGSLWLLVIAIVVAAPLVEETVFRGFLLPGLAASRLGIWGAIVATSVGWAVLHLQYQPFYLMQIVALGIVFGWLRWRSGTMTLTLILHGIVNLVAILQAAVVVEWLS